MKIINIKGAAKGEVDIDEELEDLPFSKANFGHEYVDRDPHKVTEIKPSLHDENRVNIFMGGEFAFSLDISQVVDLGVKVGKSFTDAEKKELEHASEFGKLYTNTLEWVVTRPHSVKETRDHLKRKLLKRMADNARRRANAERMKTDPDFARLREEYKIQTKERKLFNEEDIEKVISRLLEKKYLDDYNFARWFIENRNLKKGVSKMRLRQELAKKGVNSGIVAELMESSDRDEETEIKKVIKKKGKRMEPSKLLRNLVAHGFPFDLSKKLVDAYFADPENFFGEDEFLF